MARARLVLAVLASVSTMTALLVVAPANATLSPPELLDPPRYGVITDPGQTEGRSMTIYYEVRNPSQSVSWELRNSDDDLVLGPYDLGTKTGFAIYNFIFDPTAHSGSALPDGAYSIVLTASASGETPVSDQRTVHLAFNPPRATSAEVIDAQRDVWPGSNRARSQAVDRSHASLVTSLIDGVQLPEFGSASPASFTVRNTAGNLIRRDTVRGSSFSDGGTDDHYPWTWDGKNQAGKLRPPGRYPVSLTANDNWGRATTVPVGSIWIGHRVTRRLVARFDPVVARYSAWTVKGRCSSITYPGPHGWPGSAGLLSESRCKSRTGTADQVFKSFYLHKYRDSASTILALRVDAFGTPMGRHQHATMVLQTGTRQVAWHRVAVLHQGLRWHLGKVFRFRHPGPNDGALSGVAQVRVTNGSRYDLKYLRATWTFRDWRR